MGVRGGDNDNKPKNFRETVFPAYGTLAQLLAFSRKQDAKVGADEPLLDVKSADLDKFQEIIEAGTRVGAAQRKILIAIPICGLVATVVFWIVFNMIFLSKAKGLDSLEPFEFLSQYGFVNQGSLVVFDICLVMLLAVLQPTFIRSITYTCVTLIVFFIYCGLVM